jgi:hypothetical protein
LAVDYTIVRVQEEPHLAKKRHPKELGGVITKGIRGDHNKVA